MRTLILAVFMVCACGAIANTQAQGFSTHSSGYTDWSGAYWESREAPAWAVPSGNMARTITAWVELADNQQEHEFWGQNTLSGHCDPSEFSIGFKPDVGFWTTACNVAVATGPAPAPAGSMSYPAGAWYHVAVTWEPYPEAVGGLATVFVNGVSGAPATWTKSLGTSLDRVVLGARVVTDGTDVNGLIHPWQGVADSFHLYSRVLSSSELLDDMAGVTASGLMLAIKAQVTTTWATQITPLFVASTASSSPNNNNNHKNGYGSGNQQPASNPLGTPSSVSSSASDSSNLSPSSNPLVYVLGVLCGVLLVLVGTLAMALYHEKRRSDMFKAAVNSHSGQQEGVVLGDLHEDGNGTARI